MGTAIGKVEDRNPRGTINQNINTNNNLQQRQQTNQKQFEFVNNPQSTVTYNDIPNNIINQNQNNQQIRKQNTMKYRVGKVIYIYNKFSFKTKGFNSSI